MPEVSVIVPVYNRAGIVDEAIASVLAQTFEDYEIIVVDDGSTDGTVDVVQAIEDPRIMLCRHERNKGEAEARNTGVSRATGRYVAWLDSDDLWHPAKLEHQITAMRTQRLPASCTWFSVETGKNRQRKKRWTKQSRNWFRTLLFHCPLGHGTTMAVERELYDRVGLYDATIHHGTDTDWLLRLSRQVPITMIAEDLALVRRWHDSGAALLAPAGSDPLARFGAIWLAADGTRPNLSRWERRRFRAGVAAHRSALCHRQGDYTGIVRYLAEAAWLAPTAMAAYCVWRFRNAFRSLKYF